MPGRKPRWPSVRCPRYPAAAAETGPAELGLSLDRAVDTAAMSVKLRTATLDGLVEGWLAEDLDAWTRKVPRRHFDPEGGSVYWLKRRAELDFDPLDISRYEELAAFEHFD